MATGAILHGPIPTGLHDLRCRSPRQTLPILKSTVACHVGKPFASAVSGVSRWSLAREQSQAASCHAAAHRSFLQQQQQPLYNSGGRWCNSPTSPSYSLCQHQQQHRPPSRSRPVAPNAAATAAGPGDVSPEPAAGLMGEVQRLASALSHQTDRFCSLSGKFAPMVGLFFMLAFVNTILDSLKDTLVITAVGGGAQVIPYLTVYAVLPSSLVFLLLYSYASQRFRRQALFNGIVATFMGFFVLFAAFLYPHHAALHPTAWADSLAASLPLGLGGGVGMMRNWTFTLFFCMSELWGDVCLGLLFWGLANDTTSLADAPTLYPLFGIGANVAQALAGFVLKFFSRAADPNSSSFTSEVQALMGVVLVFSVAALVLHQAISTVDNAARKLRRRQQHAEKAAVRAAVAAAAAEAVAAHQQKQLKAAVDEVAAAADGLVLRGPDTQLTPPSGPSSSGAVGAAVGGGGGEAEQGGGRRSSSLAKWKGKDKQKLSDIYRTLASSPPIRCLVVMSVAQGLCSNLMEFAWKSHIRALFPTPAAFTAFLGDVSTWQGVVTGLLMVLSPTMFERMGWSGVASATPQILLYGGGAFFAAAMVYQYLLAPSAAAAASGAALAVLQGIVYGGALLYVFSKSAKFSLFKPAEEMVYISLDEEGRTKGKAAIDVVGSQAGKSGGSVLQQVLLVLCGGAIAGQLLPMVVVYLAMSRGWLGAVGKLATVNNYGHASSVHESMLSEEGSVSDPGTMDEEDEGVERRGGGVGAGEAGGRQGGGGSGGSGQSPVGHGVNGYSNGNGNGCNGANGSPNGVNGHSNGYNGGANGCNGSNGHNSAGGGNGFKVLNGPNGHSGLHSLNGANGHNGLNGHNGAHGHNGFGDDGATALRDAPLPAIA